MAKRLEQLQVAAVEVPVHLPDEPAELEVLGLVVAGTGNGTLHADLLAALLEAQAAGLPVVACRTAGVPEVVLDGRTGILTPPGDAGALAQAIDSLVDDEALARSLGDNAREFVMTERSQPVIARQISTLLLSALEHVL